MKDKIKTCDVRLIANALHNDRISVTIRKYSLNTVECSDIGRVQVDDCDVQKAISAFASLLSLGM